MSPVLGILWGAEAALGTGWEDRETREAVECMSGVQRVKDGALCNHVTSLPGKDTARSPSLSLTRIVQTYLFKALDLYVPALRSPVKCVIQGWPGLLLQTR